MLTTTLVVVIVVIKINIERFSC